MPEEKKEATMQEVTERLEKLERLLGLQRFTQASDSGFFEMRNANSGVSDHCGSCISNHCGAIQEAR